MIKFFVFANFHVFFLEGYSRKNVTQLVSNVLLNDMKPFTWYKLAISVQTRFLEGPTSIPTMNRTKEGGKAAADFFNTFLER